MAMGAFFSKSLLIFWSRVFFRRFCSNITTTTYATYESKHLNYTSMLRRSDLKDRAVIFNMERALLRSSSVFSYFMLVAFEAGGILRAMVLLLLYPVVCLATEEMRVRIMTMVCFFGVKKESLRVGKAVLPKFLLEDVGGEIFEVVNKCGWKVGVSAVLPRVMVESFLKEYLEVDVVVGRELKVFGGYFVGLLEGREKLLHALEVAVNKGKNGFYCDDEEMIGISGGLCTDFDFQLFSPCKEVYMVAESDKKNWQKLEKYPNPLIFHDGRLALRPTPLNSLAMLMWAPCGLIIALIRSIVGLSFPYNIAAPLLAMSGFHFTLTMPKNTQIIKKPNKPKAHLYVCNHRTLLDPLYISFVLRSRNMVAVTYSLSRVSELLSPIKTVRLTRNRNEDSKMMRQLLKQHVDMVVCPEGTTCREPYLLRFSPLFVEMYDEIAPIAIDSHVSMFHGTTAGGLKYLDPVFLMMNPYPIYSIRFLEKVSPSPTASRFEVANLVQMRIGDALGFECTKLTRKDKYMILAGNEGVVSTKRMDLHKMHV